MNTVFNKRPTNIDKENKLQDLQKRLEELNEEYTANLNFALIEEIKKTEKKIEEIEEKGGIQQKTKEENQQKITQTLQNTRWSTIQLQEKWQVLEWYKLAEKFEANYLADIDVLLKEDREENTKYIINKEWT